jgi:hypothetical protein
MLRAGSEIDRNYPTCKTVEPLQVVIRHTEEWQAGRQAGLEEQGEKVLR